MKAPGEHWYTIWQTLLVQYHCTFGVIWKFKKVKDQHYILDFDVKSISVKFNIAYSSSGVTINQLSCELVHLERGFTPGVGTPILEHGREVRLWWPPFFVQSDWVPQHNLIDFLFLEKKSVCLYHI